MNLFRCSLLLPSLAAAVTHPGGPSPAPALTAVAAAAAAPAAPAVSLPATLGGPSPLYTPYACAASPNQEVIHAVIRKISAALSILGSSYIVGLVWVNWRKDRKSLDPYQRIMAAISVHDILLSFFVFFMGSWMTPAVTGWWGAAGTAATCSIQGFFFIFAGLGSVLYQMLLALQMMLLVSYNWRARDFERRIEHRMHWCILVLAAILAAAPLIYQGYNPACGYCAAVPFPASCGDWLFGDGTTECLRGSDTLANIHAVIFSLTLIVAIVFCTGAMVSIYRSVYKQEQRNARFRHGNVENHAKSKSLRKRMLLYTSTFYICWILPPVFASIPNAPPALSVVEHVLAPLMGFLNMLIFFLPKCDRYQREHVGTWLPAAYFHILLAAPLARIACWRASAGREVEGPGVVEDDDIGLGKYNEQVEVPAEEAEGGERAAAGGTIAVGDPSS